MNASNIQPAPELASQTDPNFEIKVGEFMVVDYPEPHLERGRRLLRKHPEITKLFGRNPWTLPIAMFTSGSQVAMTWAVVHYELPWWGVLLAAFAIGAFFCNANAAIIHDASHDRVFKNRFLNELTGWIANLIDVLPVSSSFRIYHVKHHRFQGDPDFDADMASEREAKLFGNSFLGKLAWQFLFPITQSVRTGRFVKNGKISFLTPWVLANWVVQFSFDILMYLWLGPMALLYLVASFVFSLGPHPLGARYVQEHFIFNKNQETYSYYGPANLVTLNVYHHNEHHDFPAVPWNRLPQVRKAIPEVYGELYAHKSLTALWLKFLFDPSISLHRRVVRHYKFDKSTDPAAAPGAPAPAAPALAAAAPAAAALAAAALYGRD